MLEMWKILFNYYSSEMSARASVSLRCPDVYGADGISGSSFCAVLIA